jgi:hypothetical protein
MEAERTMKRRLARNYRLRERFATAEGTGREFVRLFAVAAEDT